ncbi:MAG: DNA alkylation repair protein [Oscillospiraceae bacterium]
MRKPFSKEAEAGNFSRFFAAQMYEASNLRAAFWTEAMKDYHQVVAALDAFLPYVDNWATCDLIRPKVFGKHLPELREQIRIWLPSDHPYTIRFGMEMLMTFFLDGQFQPEYLDWVAGVESKEYYVNMMAAWYFATALAKQYDAVLPYHPTAPPGALDPQQDHPEGHGK